MEKLEKSVTSFLQEQNTCISELNIHYKDICKIIKTLIQARDTEKIIFTIGNGGSGSTASHFVSDLLKTAITKGENRFSAISLVDNVPVLLAWSNDSNYDDIFVEQLKNHLSKNDIIIGFSGSGKSQNILNAFTYGKEQGAFCIGITGMSGGKFPNMCDICLIVPNNDMLTIESVHLMLCHCIVSAIRKRGEPMFRYE